MSIRTLLVVALLTCTWIPNAHASPIAGDGAWHEFDVDSLLSGGLGWIDGAGAPLSFDFTINPGQQGYLAVVDAGFAGDTFTVLNGVALLGPTSAVPTHLYDPADIAVTDFDAALADPNFSRAIFSLGAGTYSVSGALVQSVQDAFGPLESTLGGLRLQVEAVPEPASLAMLATGLGLLLTAATRRSR